MPEYTSDPALVELAKASGDPDAFQVVHSALMSTYESSSRIGHMTQFADEVSALAVAALAADGRLPVGEVRTEYGTRITWGDGTVDDVPCESREFAQRRVDLHARRRRELPVWSATAELIQRINVVGPWQPVPGPATAGKPAPEAHSRRSEPGPATIEETP